MIDIRRLRVLCEVARHGSFSAAAAALGYTQPAVSRQVALLEAEMGTTLVRRLPQGVVLTDSGRLLVRRGEAIMAQLDDVEVELRALQGLQGGRVRFAAFASACASMVPLAIARFRERYPAVELNVTMADPAESLPKLMSGEVDLIMSHDPFEPPLDAIVGAHGSEGSGRGTIEAIPLFEDPMYVAMPLGHRLADADTVSMVSLASEPWMIATPKTCPDSKLFLRACHAAGFEPRIAFENDDYSAVLGFVAAGVGIALIPDMIARVARAAVVIRPLDPPPPPRPITAVVPVGYRSPAVEALLEVLGEVAEEWVRDGAGSRGTRVDVTYEVKDAAVEDAAA